MNSIDQISLDAALDRQKKAWQSGNRPTVHDFLHDTSLASHSDVVLDLIYNEVVLREEMGESPSVEEYVEQYPHLCEDLRLQFEVHHAVQQDLLSKTQEFDSLETIAEIGSHGAETGPQIDGYQILGELGQGGMGIVYKARHTLLKRIVALKTFHPGRRPRPRELARFRSESQAVARLQHPNIVQIFEVGESGGVPFLALEYVEKGTLQQKLQEMPLAPKMAAELIEVLARAIQHAHQHQVIHRDLKPANVLFTSDGTPKVSDFGLAKLLETDPDDQHDATRSGEPIGTPRYMAPEQTGMKPGTIGPATDVYALGTLLYECLTGQVPFVSPSVIETIDRIRKAEPVPPRKLQSAIPKDLETICLHCLNKQPERRYPSAEALAADLRYFLNGEPILARPASFGERMRMKAKRHPAKVVALGFSCFLLLAAAVAVPVRHVQERNRVAAARADVERKEQQATVLLAEGNPRKALDTYLAALAIISAEPDLHDHALGVRGWLDHCLREIEKQRWKEHDRMPPLFQQRKDEAFVAAMLIGTNGPESLEAQRRKVAKALEFAVGDEPNIVADRAALERLDAVLLQELEPAIRKLPTPFTGSPAFQAFFDGIERMRQQRWAEAVSAFHRTLALEPEHFLARYLLAACLMELGKPREAEIALTACIGQRPNFAWNHLARAKANLSLGDWTAAAEDLQTAVDLQPELASLGVFTACVRSLNEAFDALPAERKEQLGKEPVPCAQGRRPLQDVLISLGSLRTEGGRSP